MNETTLHIKNMVCPRCIMVVRDKLNELEIKFQDVQLGQVILSDPINEKKLKSLSSQLDALGFELLEPGKSALISQIKTVIIEQIHHKKEPLAINFSPVERGVPFFVTYC